jgi:hypothetical protein
MREHDNYALVCGTLYCFNAGLGFWDLFSFFVKICAEKKLGQVAEWFKALDSKSSVLSKVPWVRLPPCPPFARSFTSSNLRKQGESSLCK